MDSGLLQAAAAEYVRTSKWMPKPFELISLANDFEVMQIREGTRALPAPDRGYTPLAKLIELNAKFEAMGIKNKHIDRCIVEAKVREGIAA